MQSLSSLSPQPKAPVAGDPVRDVSLDNFVAEVVEGSRDRIIVVDFWATWCGPCKQLGPALEKVIRAHNGAVRLAKIDIDKNPEIAQQMRIQSVPAVFAFYKGQPVDGFMGAMPESEIKTWLDRLIKATGATGPAAEGDEAADINEALAQANEFLANNDVPTAQAIFADILDRDPSHGAAYAGLLRCLIAMGDMDNAKRMLASAPPAIAKDKAMDSVRAAIELAEQTAQIGPAAELQARLDKNPADHQTRFDLAMALYAQGEREQAVDHLLEIVRRQRSWNEDAARKQLVKLFDAFGQTDPLTLSARKRLSSIMFS